MQSEEAPAATSSGFAFLSQPPAVVDQQPAQEPEKESVTESVSAQESESVPEAAPVEAPAASSGFAFLSQPPAESTTVAVEVDAPATETVEEQK